MDILVVSDVKDTIILKQFTTGRVRSLFKKGCV